MPKTKIGQLSIWLVGAFAVLFALFNLAAVAGGILETTGTKMPEIVFAITLVLAAITGIASLMTALWAVSFKKERSPIMIAPILLGSIILVFTLGEIFSSH